MFPEKKKLLNIRKNGKAERGTDMLYKEKNYRDGASIVPKKIAGEIKKGLTDVPNNLKQYQIKRFNDDFMDYLIQNGWTKKIILTEKSKISISAAKQRIGLCIQTGNMARFYADLIKMQALFLNSKITSAIYIIPTKECAREIGSNVANFERLVNELENVFSKVITVPMLIIGFYKGEE